MPAYSKGPKVDYRSIKGRLLAQILRQLTRMLHDHSRQFPRPLRQHFYVLRYPHPPALVHLPPLAWLMAHAPSLHPLFALTGK